MTCSSIDLRRGHSHFEIIEPDSIFEDLIALQPITIAMNNVQYIFARLATNAELVELFGVLASLGCLLKDCFDPVDRPSFDKQLAAKHC